MVKRAGRSVENDPGLASLFAADADAITFVAKAWDYHVRVALGSTLEENLDADKRSRSRRRACRGREVILDCEHFFDGYKGNAAYALAVAEAASRPARAGSCSATPMAERCRMRSNASSKRCGSAFPAAARHPRA